MIDVSPDERAVLTAIRDHPGLSTRTLARTLKRRPAAIVACVRGLTEKRQVERRPLKIQLSDGRPKTVAGLYAVVSAAVDPNLCPSCGARRRHFEGGPECHATTELRSMGEQLEWSRVPYGYNKVIQSGKLQWEEWLNRADYPALVAGMRHAKAWLELNSQIRRREVTAGA